MIVSCGEGLIDFVPARSSEGDAAYRPCVGGSPFNVAMTAGRLGASVGYLGRLSTDFFGDRIMAELSHSKVSDRFVERSDEASTLSFVSLPEDGEPRYAFFGGGAADRNLSLSHARLVLDPGVSCLHFGSFSLAVEPVGSVLTKVMAEASRDRIISLDPNVRPTLIENQADYADSLKQWIGFSDIVKVSQADIEWLHPGASPLDIASNWSRQGPTAVIVTRGGEGAAVFRDGKLAFQRSGTRITLVDTVGAGDSFQGGLLFRLQRDGWLNDKASVRSVDDAGLAAAVDTAIMVSGITCTRQGANPPWSHELPGDRDLQG